jgi:predicted flavoprotein YhiN
VRFVPELTSLRQAGSGPVIRVVGVQDHSGKRPSRRRVLPQSAIPTFWTLLDVRAPHAWAGSWLRSLPEKKSCCSRHRALDRWEGARSVAYLADWQADPYARGGYSYAKVGGAGTREILQRSLDDTLYFAGEATDVEEAGTVGGALASGQRAAREILGA